MIAEPMSNSNDEFACLAKEFRAALESRLAEDASGEYCLPSKDAVAAFCSRYLEVLFPVFYSPGEPLSAKSAGVLEILICNSPSKSFGRSASNRTAAEGSFPPTWFVPQRNWLQPFAASAGA